MARKRNRSRTVVLAVFGTWFIVGCSAASAPAGSMTNDGSTDWTAATGGTGGIGGTAGTGANLPRCAVVSRPADPVFDGGASGSGGPDTCNSLTAGGAWLDWEAFRPSMGGIALAGGGLELPKGGTLVDGDYNLIRYRQNNDARSRTRRSIRVFDHGAYFEWSVDVDDDSGSYSITLNTRMRADGAATLNVDGVDCSKVTFPTTSYGYTAQGDLLNLYYYDQSVPGPAAEIEIAYTYQRQCVR